MDRNIEKKLQAIEEKKERFAREMELLEKQKEEMIQQSYKNVIQYCSDLNLHNLDERYIIGALVYAKQANDENNKEKLNELETLAHDFLRQNKRRSKINKTKKNSKDNISDEKTDTKDDNA